MTNTSAVEALWVFKHCSNLAVFVTEILWYSPLDFQIDRYHVLSAAHCFAPFHPRMFKVRVGVTNTSQSVGGQSIPVDDVISHPSYDYDDMTRRQGLHDIAVIRLTHSIKWTDQRLIFSLRGVVFFLFATPSTVATPLPWTAMPLWKWSGFWITAERIYFWGHGKLRLSW